MTTSRLMPLTLEARSSSLALPSGFRTDLSKSKKASAEKVTLEATAGAGAGAGAGAAGAGVAAGATAAATGFRAPSQSAAAVAGGPVATGPPHLFVAFFPHPLPVPVLPLST